MDFFFFWKYKVCTLFKNTFENCNNICGENFGQSQWKLLFEINCERWEMWVLYHKTCSLACYFRGRILGKGSRMGELYTTVWEKWIILKISEYFLARKVWNEKRNLIFWIFFSCSLLKEYRRGFWMEYQ